MLTDDAFHGTGVPLPPVALPPDGGRAVGGRQALDAEFACTRRYGGAGPDDCAGLRFAATEREGLVRACETASLRDVAERAPYMHAGQQATPGGDEFQLTHEVLAQMLAVRRAGVTVAAGVLQRAGLITYSRGRLRVVDRPGLEAAACECYAVIRAHTRRLLGDMAAPA